MKNYIIAGVSLLAVGSIAIAKIQLMKKDAELAKIKVELKESQEETRKSHKAFTAEKESLKRMQLLHDNCRKAAESHEADYNSLYNQMTEKEQREERLRIALAKEKAKRICEPNETVCPETDVFPELAEELNKQTQEFKR